MSRLGSENGNEYGRYTVLNDSDRQWRIVKLGKLTKEPIPDSLFLAVGFNYFQ